MKYKDILGKVKDIKSKKFVLGFVVGAILPSYLYLANYVHNIDFGSVGEWIGSLATALAIYMVIWQVNKTLKSEKELEFSKSRPFFVLEQNVHVNDLAKMDICFLCDEEKKKDSKKNTLTDEYIIKIHNISNKKMMAIKIVGQSINNNFTFYINYLNSGQTKCLGFPSKRKEISKLTIYFHTELRERLKLVWEKKSNAKVLTYTQKYLSNRLDNSQECEEFKEYDVNNFHESSFLKICNCKKPS